jgi:hypothetical protein
MFSRALRGFVLPSTIYWGEAGLSATGADFAFIGDQVFALGGSEALVFEEAPGIGDANVKCVNQPKASGMVRVNRKSFDLRSASAI